MSTQAKTQKPMPSFEIQQNLKKYSGHRTKTNGGKDVLIIETNDAGYKVLIPQYDVTYEVDLFGRVLQTQSIRVGQTDCYVKVTPLDYNLVRE